MADYNDKQKTDAQLMSEAKEESYVQGQETEGTHLEGAVEAKADKKEAIKKKLSQKQASRDGSDGDANEYGQAVDEVIVHPHRLVQPHRIEANYPEVEVRYGALDEEKAELLAEAHSKGVKVPGYAEKDDIREEIDRVDSERQDALENYKPVAAQMLFDHKTYHNNQMFLLAHGQVVEGPLAEELISVGVAQKFEDDDDSDGEDN